MIEMKQRPHIMDRLSYPLDTSARETIVPQGYVAYNRGDMLVPSGYVNPESIRSALATPWGQGGQKVHAIPITYVRVTADVRSRSMVGMITPEYKEIGLGNIQ